MATRGVSGRIQVFSSQYMSGLPVPTFLLRKLAYYRRLRRDALDPLAAEAVDYVTALRRDGIVIVPGFLDADSVETMRAALPNETAFEVAGEGEPSHFYSNANRICELAPFFDHPIIRATARSYISKSAISLRRTVALKIVQGDILSFERFAHMDSWKMRFKAFLFLEEIHQENAPMIYLTGSHHGVWRLPMEARIAGQFRTDQRGFAVPEDYYIGCFWPHEVQRLAETYGYREITCTGPAGTLMMFDGRGLHRATPLRSGRRLMLTSYWIHPGNHI
jgi:hypothetical protein